ncbi:MAG: hypothetical protein ACRD40_02790 [Candidatus Acidiferrales bacterium]
MKKLAIGSVLLIASLVFGAAAIGQMGGGLQMPTPQGIFNPVVGGGGQYNVTTKNGTKMNVEIAIVGKESSGGKDAYWYETTADTERGSMSVKMLLVPNGNSSSIAKTVFLMPGRGPMEMDGQMGGPMAQNQQPKDIRDDAKNLGSESVTVPAGTFTCDHWKGNDGSDVWVTKGVPPYGLVKMTQQDGSTVVLTKVLTNYQDKITGTPMNMTDMMRGMGRGPQQ